MRNILADMDGTLAAMAQIEERRWLWRQMDELTRSPAEREERPISANGFAAYFDWLEQLKRDRIVATTHRFCVYGDGGWHRWFVTMDGAVSFSIHHGSGSARRAEELSFDVF